MPDTALSRSHSIMASSIVWDNHGCMPLRADDSFLPQLERYRAAGVTIASLNVGYAQMSTAEHMRVLSYMRMWIAKHPDKYRLIATVDDVRRCKADGKLGIHFDIEGMVPVEDDISFVQTFYELGVKWMLIAYNRNNKAGGGCLDEDGGLTQRGREIIDEMNRVGMVLCLSHTGARTVAEALDYARGPVIFSHSNVHADFPHPRNVSDALIKACAAKGGVFGLSGIGGFLGQHHDVDQRFMTQLRYVIDLVGPDHVGISLDYVFDEDELTEYVRKNPHLFAADTKTGAERGTVKPEAYPFIAEELARDNLTDAEIGAVLGGNWLRIAEQVWK